MAPALYPALTFDPAEALTPITLVTDSPSSVIVRAASPLKDFADLLAKGARHLLGRAPGCEAARLQDQDFCAGEPGRI